MLNTISIQGRLVYDPEIRVCTRGDSSTFLVAKYRLAVERDRADGDGNRQADFINVDASGRMAEFAEKHFQKGMMVIVTGSLYLEPYEKDGVKCFGATVKARRHYPIFPPKAEGQDEEEENPFVNAGK